MVVGDPVAIEPVLRDPTDDYLVALARQEDVDAIVSDDHDLLEAPLSTRSVWSPRECADRLASR